MFSEEHNEDAEIMKSIAYAEKKIGQKMITPKKVRDPDQPFAPVKYDIENESNHVDFQNLASDGSPAQEKVSMVQANVTSNASANSTANVSSNASANVSVNTTSNKTANKSANATKALNKTVAISQKNATSNVTANVTKNQTV